MTEPRPDSYRLNLADLMSDLRAIEEKLTARGVDLSLVAVKVQPSVGDSLDAAKVSASIFVDPGEVNAEVWLTAKPPPPRPLSQLHPEL